MQKKNNIKAKHTKMSWSGPNWVLNDKIFDLLLVSQVLLVMYYIVNLLYCCQSNPFLSAYSNRVETQEISKYPIWKVREQTKIKFSISSLQFLH